MPIPSNAERVLKTEEKRLVENVNYGEIFKFCNDLLGATKDSVEKAFLTQKIMPTLLHSQSLDSAIKAGGDRQRFFDLIDKVDLRPTFSKLTQMQNSPKSKSDRVIPVLPTQSNNYNL